VYSAAIQDDGTLGAWREETPLPQGRYQISLTAWAGRLFLPGGYAGGFHNEVFTAPLLDDGKVGQWSTATSLPIPYLHTASVVWAGRLILLGGGDAGTIYIDDGFVASIEPDGLGAWRSFHSGHPRAGISMTVWDGKVYAAGGGADEGSYDDVYSSVLPPAGDWPARWTRLSSSLPIAVEGHGTGVWNGTLYSLGGWSRKDQTSNSAMHSAEVGSNGALTPWREQEARLPMAMFAYGYRAPAWNGNLYVAGGSVAKGGPGAGYSEVYVVRLEQKGSVRSGTYFNSFDLGTDAPASSISWTAKLNGGSLKVRIRTARSGGTYSDWVEAASGDVLRGTRHIEYRVDMSASPSGESPILHKIGVFRVP
jgi:hypothetical protein